MSNAKTPEDDDGWPQSTPAQFPSNQPTCRARRTGFGDYVACLEEPPHDCGYALHLGEEYLCLHPHHLEFAARTQAAQHQ